MSGLEERLERLLDELDISFVRELPAGKYVLDFYSYDFHIGIEADGPHHSLRRRRDKERDAYLFEHFGIKVLRITQSELSNGKEREGAKWTVTEFIKKWSPSALERSRQLRKS